MTLYYNPPMPNTLYHFIVNNNFSQCRSVLRRQILFYLQLNLVFTILEWYSIRAAAFLRWFSFKDRFPSSERYYDVVRIFFIVSVLGCHSRIVLKFVLYCKGRHQNGAAVKAPHDREAVPWTHRELFTLAAWLQQFLRMPH